jgi:hypothetical protein
VHQQILIDVKLKTGKTGQKKAADSKQSIKEADWTALPSKMMMKTKKKKEANIFGQQISRINEYNESKAEKGHAGTNTGKICMTDWNCDRSCTLKSLPVWHSVIKIIYRNTRLISIIINSQLSLLSPHIFEKFQPEFHTSLSRHSTSDRTGLAIQPQ